MTVKKQPDSDAASLPAAANDWYQTFLRILEGFLAETGRTEPECDPSELPRAAVNAVRLTLLDSGMSPQELRKLFLEVATSDQELTASIETDAMGYPAGYFEATEGSFSTEPLERPADLPLEQRESW